MKTNQLFLALLMTLSSASTFAQDVDIDGDVTQTVNADNILNGAGGVSSTAEQILASVRGDVTVGGSVNQSITAKNITNLALGLRSDATQLISSIDSH